MSALNPALQKILLKAYAPCPGFSQSCQDMRWQPDQGFVPIGFCGATGSIEEVALVLVVAEPGDPHVGARHPADPCAALESAYAYAYECFHSGKDLFHRNIRHILNLCWPNLDFDAQMRRTWITESVLCSAQKESGSVPARVSRACRTRFLEAQLALFPTAVVAALGTKAVSRLGSLASVSAGAAAPPGCNRKEVQESWLEIAHAVHARAV